MRRLIVLASAALAAALAGCGGSSSRHATPHAPGGLPARAKVVFASDHATPAAHTVSAKDTGTLAASLHFDPGADGFSFQNYGFIAGTDLDPHAMRELFGDVVCAGTPSDSCPLTPSAQQFADAIGQYMFGGHCFGFAMVSLRFFRHLLNPQTFGASTTYGLSLSPELQSEVAASWATQVLPDVQRADISATPSQIISLLEKEMANPNGDPYTLGFGNGKQPPDYEGHEVTPIGVQNLGGGRYDILIYDNNKPNTTQAIPVDTNAETWSYQVSTNPTEADTLWSGHGSFNQMVLTPLSASAKLHPCSFCGAGATGHFDTVSLGGDPSAHGHLLISTADGRRLGYLGGRFIDEIPGARVIRPQLSEIWKARPEPIYEVPANLKVTVSLTGGPAHPALPAQVSVIGPGFGATAANLAPAAGTIQLTVSPGARAVSIRTLGHSGTTVPKLSVGVNRGRGGSIVTVSPHALRPGSGVSLAVPASGPLTVTGHGASGPAAVTVQSVGGTGSKTVHSSDVGLSSGRSMTIGLVHVG